MVKFDLNSFYVMRKFRWLGVSITCDIINAGWICTANILAETEHTRNKLRVLKQENTKMVLSSLFHKKQQSQY